MTCEECAASAQLLKRVGRLRAALLSALGYWVGPHLGLLPQEGEGRGGTGGCCLAWKERLLFS